MKKQSMLLIPLLAILPMTSCASGSNEESNSNEESQITSVEESTSEASEVESASEDGKATFVNVHPVSYSNVNLTKDMDAFYKETKASNGYSNDGPLDYGFVKSVWHTLVINNQKVNVYSARCGYDVHSFAYVDVETDGEFTLDIDLQVENTDFKKVTVLPEKENVTATIDKGQVTSSISSFGSFSFVFDEEPYMALTLYVAPYTKLEIPEGYDTVTIEPGLYENNEDLAFSQTNTVYLFKKGVYDISNISIPSNSIAYFESGCYMRVFENEENDYHYGLSSNGNNVKVLGRSLFDFSKCIGGDAKTKGVYNFAGENVYVEGVITVNSNNWSMCFSAAKNAEITRCMFFSYRTFSDGVMFADCEDCYAHDNFVRTGDDAMEVKACTNSANQTNNILFENNNVWTDKGIAYGCIYESVHDVENVIFKNNAVGFAQASWSEHLGCCTMQMGSMYKSTWHDVRFEDIEVYKTSCALISVYNRALNSEQGGKIKNIYFKNITAKYTKQINLPVYCINVVIRLAEGVSYQNSVIGTLYMDNISYEGVDITANNYLQYTNIALSDEAKFSKSNIKINTLSE